MKICTIVGARPQFVKAAVVSAKFAELKKEFPDSEEIIVHTGQHYDPEMSEIFFSELGIPREKYNLAVGSGKHGEQTAKMLHKIEEVLLAEKPDWLLIYGDTNSTIAGSLAAAKLQIPCAHVEAGMRSFNRAMPEEINRIVADHLSELNFCSSETALSNLKNEGRGHTAELVGDVMFDSTLKFSQIAEKRSEGLGKYGLAAGTKYFLMTCHRQENTDCIERLIEIVEAANEISRHFPIIFPIHPRTSNYLKNAGISFSKEVKIVSPVGYLDMLFLIKNARIVLTDSGGVQKEAFFLKTPCVTMRNETEWVETVSLGWNILAGAKKDQICNAVAKFAENPPPAPKTSPYGDGNASEKIVRRLLAGKI